MADTTADVLHSADDLTPTWLSRVLGAPVEAVSTEPIGTGQMSDSHRVTIGYAPGAPDDAPASVVVKTAAADATSRATGVGLGAYAREVRFYEQLAGRLSPGPLARCHAALLDEADGWFTLVLEDVGAGGTAYQGDQLTGCSPDEAELCMRELARLHAPVLGDPHVSTWPWLNQPSPLDQALLGQLLPAFADRYADRIAPEHLAVCQALVERLDAWTADRQPPLGLVHGDFRLDNLLFGGPGAPRPLTVVDWQTVSIGPVLLDASYFLGGSLTLEDRRAHEEALVRTYHDALRAAGADALSWEDVWTDYRRQVFHGVVMAVAASLLVVRTERGDDMFMTTLARHAQQALDLDALDLLPAGAGGRPAALRPDPADEGRHPQGADEFWNESWYLDAVAEDGSVGAYVRLGLTPNLGGSWITAFVCGPDRPTVALVEFSDAEIEAPLRVDTGTIHLDLETEVPLERFRVRAGGRGEAHEDPSALLRGEPGTPTDVELDLVWTTHGAPYLYRRTTRYEIPCLVEGTLTVGGEPLTLRGVGQRDHSWGTRDWWALDWVWFAGHLDDGTRLHGVEIRLPDGPRLGVGYLQPPGDEVVELDGVGATEEVGEDGLITAARVVLSPVALEVVLEPVGWGPLRIEAPDGRVSLFPRAMCRLRAEDGRTGWGWAEWNRNVARA